MSAQIKLSDIEMDATIQCRASIDVATVNEYAERMTAGDQFPPVSLFRNGSARCWIGDGWHRIMGAQQIGALTIDATITNGGRADALEFALGANALHGHRRTNADKRRCVEIALKEFASMSSRAIAEMCGVSNHTVEAARPQVGKLPTSKVTGADGKLYPATKKPAAERVKEIYSLVAEGHNIKQIAEKLGIGKDYVAILIDEHDIKVTQHARPKQGNRAGNISQDRVMQETVDALAGIAQGLNLVRSKKFTFGAAQAAELLAEARASLRVINSAMAALKEIANG